MEQQNNLQKVQHWYLHIDLDAFFASVEQLDNPSYRGKPVIVGGRRDDKRGVVSTASYEARAFGVHSAMPTFKALILCPEGIFVRGRMSRYAELSYRIMNIFREYSPDVEQMSIDEAFIDLTGTEQLFGPPEETAMLIKRQVKKETGLTVSVGLATTKYLAKIASGYSKPDGFYFVHPGQEMDFMLNLPLRKVWGLGPRALEKLEKAGITSTRDIYEMPFDLLSFHLGPSMATFLYNVVRGQENESFNRQAKSHSISAENTYHDDITDVYTAETALLELAQGVMLRLLKEEKFSRTVTVKIKYDDFTSVTIQRTCDRNILTVDSFFEVIKELFEEKYQVGRAIRLLGVGFDKVEKDDKPYQPSLFDNDSSDKKQAVEKAILDLNQRHPEIKIQKARLLKSLLIGFLSLSLLTPRLEAQDNKNITLPPPIPLPTIPEEAPSSFYQWDINDKNTVEFNVNGFWKGDIQGSFPFSFGKNIPFTFNPSLPVFKQDIELSSYFLLNKQWFFEANFADNFNNNTIAIGFMGDNYLRNAKLSNRNITMPNIYSSKEFGYSLSGGNNQSPGISVHWEAPSNKWSSDLLFRYDMTAPKTDIFYGMNKVQKRLISPSSFLYGHSFTFPEDGKEELSNISGIYVENSNGKYTDEYGIKYNKLSLSDYYYSPIDNVLYFSSSAQTSKTNNKIPNILITFINDSSVSSIISKAGNYKDNNDDSYLGNIQKIFKNFNLEDFSYKLSTKIEGKEALKIQANEGFSPFIIADTYDIGSSQDADISIILKTNEEVIPSYYGEIKDNNNIGVNEDFFNKKTTYGKIVNKDTKYTQYPFADNIPEVYLNIDNFSDIAISLTNYTPIKSISISKKASSGTIQVYKNGVYDNNFLYDSNTGIITLLTPISSSDIIKVVYQEEASNYAKGVFSLGAGFNLNILPNLVWDISLTSQLPLPLENNYSTINNIQSSFIALTSGIDFNTHGFSLNDKVSFSVQKNNSSDVLLVSSQNDNTIKRYNQEYNASSLVTEDINTKDFNLNKENNKTSNNLQGINDKELKGYKLPLSFSFHNSKDWGAINIKLNKGELLKNSSMFNLYIQLVDNSPYKVLVQLGVNANQDKQSNKGIKTIDITNQINFSKINDWQKISIKLDEKDRSFLVSNHDIRIIIVNKNELEKEGTIYIGPYECVTESIFTSSPKNIDVYTSSTPYNKDFYSSVISWNNNDTSLDSKITAISYFSPASFTNYKNVNFKFAFKKDSLVNIESEPTPLIISLEQNNINPLSNGDEVLKLTINDINNFISEKEDYHTVSVNLENKKVLIDNKALTPNVDYEIVIKNNKVPSLIKYEIDTANVAKGSFYVNNVTYSGSDFDYSIQNNIDASYKIGKVLNIKDFPLISNAFIDISSKQKFFSNDIYVLSNLNTGVTLANISFNTDFALSKLDFITIGHKVNTTSPLFNILSLSESYRWNKEEKSHSKENTASISLSRFKIPLNISTYFSADNNLSNIKQKHLSNISSSFDILNNNISITSSMETNQNINLQKNGTTLFNENNYFDSWKNLSSFVFSLGENNAASRKEIFSNTISFNIKNGFLTPNISYNLYGNYENINESSFEDKEIINLSIPFNFGKYNIGFNLNKTGGDITKLIEGGNYLIDLNVLFNIQKDRIGFYTSIPFYELFDKSIRNKINGNYSTKYELSFSKALDNSFRDLYIPSKASLSISRDIVSKETFSDTYQLRVSLGTNSLNNFGLNSEKKFFNWFNTEEISTGLTTTFKIPVDELSNTQFNINSYANLILFFDNGKVLNNYLDFNIDNSLNWKIGGNFNYIRKGKTSLTTAIISLFSKNFDISKYKIDRKDSFKIEIGQSSSNFKQQYDYMHNVDVSFLDHFTITTGLGGTFSYVENGAFGLNINYTLGGKITF